MDFGVFNFQTNPNDRVDNGGYFMNNGLMMSNKNGAFSFSWALGMAMGLMVDLTLDDLGWPRIFFMGYAEPSNSGKTNSIGSFSMFYITIKSCGLITFGDV